MVEGRGLSLLRWGQIMIEFLSNSGDERISLSDAAIAHMLAHRQLCVDDKEAGGQLFAQLSAGRVNIEVATGPRSADRRSRFFFAPSRIHERHEINELHQRGLHYVGDWHTHPQRVPLPSDMDMRNISEIFSQSHHSYAGILIVIVGELEPPAGIFVGIANGQGVEALVPLPTTELEA